MKTRLALVGLTLAGMIVVELYGTTPVPKDVVNSTVIEKKYNKIDDEYVVTLDYCGTVTKVNSKDLYDDVSIGRKVKVRQYISSDKKNYTIKYKGD